jgi:hypothetical protein
VTGGGGYGYGGYPYGGRYNGEGGASRKRARGCGVGEASDRRRSGEASMNSSGVGALDVGIGGVLRRSQQVCKSGLQFAMM